MSLTDTSTNSPHCFYWKHIGTTNENNNFNIRVKSVKSTRDQPSLFTLGFLHTYPDIFECATLSAFVHTYVSGKSGILIGKFFNPLSRVEIFEWAMNQESCGRLIRIFFSSTEVTRSRQVFFTVNIQDDAERNVIPSLLLKLQFYSCTVKRNYYYCTLQLCQAVARRTASFDVGRRN